MSTSISSKILLATSLIGDVFYPVKPEHFGTASVKILSGDVDESLKIFFYFQKNKSYDNIPSNVDTEEANAFVNKIKDQIRSAVSYIFNKVQEEDLLLQQQNLESLKSKLSETNKPHHNGTVAELATRLGVSKSEVRRLKAEGILDKALEEKAKA